MRYPKHLSILLFVLMFCGLFWSRAILSLTQAAWVLFALVQFNNWKPTIGKDRFFLWSCVPLLLWIAGAWQHPFQQANADYLLTLCAYPVTALAVKLVTSEEVNKKWMPVWAGATIIGLAYPLTWFLMHTTAAYKNYGMGQTLPTFMDTDHVRFGIFLCSGFLFLLFASAKKSWKRKLLLAVLFLLIVFFSVRTAWVILLISCVYFFFAVYLAQRSGKLLSLVSFLILSIAVLGVAYYLFPTVQQKIAYTIYDWQHFDPAKYDPSYSDGARRAVNQAAWLSAHSPNGANTGWAGIPAALQRSFSGLYPTATLSYGWPFNQYLYWWIGGGWPGMVLFTGWLLYPLVMGWKNKNHAVICWTIAIAVSCVAECTLSLQYGVWLHIWPLAIIWYHPVMTSKRNDVMT